MHNDGVVFCQVVQYVTPQIHDKTDSGPRHYLPLSEPEGSWHFSQDPAIGHYQASDEYILLT